MNWKLKVSFLLLFLLFHLPPTFSESFSEPVSSYVKAQKAKDISRAKIWKSKGYNFDPDIMSSYTMDQKVKDIERAKFWQSRGHNFDPEIMSSYSMDQKVKDIERAEFWNNKGYNFDPEIMSSYSMDQKVKDIERAAFWREKGHDFDPEIMSSYSMDQKVKDIERSNYWKNRGFNFDPNSTSAYSMDQKVRSQKNSEFQKREAPNKSLFSPKNQPKRKLFESNETFVPLREALSQAKLDIVYSKSRIINIQNSNKRCSINLKTKTLSDELGEERLSDDIQERNGKTYVSKNLVKLISEKFSVESEMVKTIAAEDQAITLAEISETGKKISFDNFFKESLKPIPQEKIEAVPSLPPVTYSIPKTIYEPPISYYGGKTVHVRGYFRKNGTYVSPHYRRPPRRH